MCKKIANALGGDISVESSYGAGSKMTFWIENKSIPCSKEIKQEELNSQASLCILSLSCQCSQVLVVDDEPMNIIVIQSYLKSLNIIGEEAMNGKVAVEKAINRAQSNHCKGFQLIIMDLNMPVMDGVEASEILTSLMKNGEIPKTPIIALTAAEETPFLKQKLQNAGICFLAQKPMSKDNFNKIANNFLKVPF